MVNVNYAQHPFNNYTHQLNVHLGYNINITGLPSPYVALYPKRGVGSHVKKDYATHRNPTNPIWFI